MRYVLLVLALVAAAFGQTAPNIANLTNAAMPSLDYPPASITLPPRSMATIFGTDLGDTTASAAPPWKTMLGGTEVHLADDTCFNSSCDLIASLLYSSPTQINFVIPDTGSSSPSKSYRIVLVRDGQRIDNRSYMLGGPGRLTIDAYDGDYDVVFQVGYDCLFSYSVSDPTSCGFSWSQGQHRGPLGAVTDAASGLLISSQAPVHQGQIITLWLTGLYGSLTVNKQSGLLEQAPPLPVNFGVAKLGNDVTPVIDFGMTGPYAQFGVLQPPHRYGQANRLSSSAWIKSMLLSQPAVPNLLQRSKSGTMRLCSTRRLQQALRDSRTSRKRGGSTCRSSLDRAIPTAAGNVFLTQLQPGRHVGVHSGA